MSKLVAISISCTAPSPPQPANFTAIPVSRQLPLLSLIRNELSRMELLHLNAREQSSLRKSRCQSRRQLRGRHSQPSARASAGPPLTRLEQGWTTWATHASSTALFRCCFTHLHSFATSKRNATTRRTVSEEESRPSDWPKPPDIMSHSFRSIQEKEGFLYVVRDAKLDQRLVQAVIILRAENRHPEFTRSVAAGLTRRDQS